MNAQKLNGYQVRTEKTKAQVLAAAEEVFARDGFEGAQMDSIAKAAGRSKGAIYAHYASKDDLFLALFEHRTRIEMQRVYARILRCTGRQQALEALKKSLIELAANRTWILLTIEAKLYALRHPDMRHRWLKANQTFRSGDAIYASEQQRTAELLFGHISPAKKAELEARTVAFGPLITGLVLEAEFEPKLLTKKRLSVILNQVADALLKTSKD